MIMFCAIFASLDFPKKENPKSASLQISYPNAVCEFVSGCSGMRAFVVGQERRHLRIVGDNVDVAAEYKGVKQDELFECGFITKDRQLCYVNNGALLRHKIANILDPEVFDLGYFQKITMHRGFYYAINTGSDNNISVVCINLNDSKPVAQTQYHPVNNLNLRFEPVISDARASEGLLEFKVIDKVIDKERFQNKFVDYPWVQVPLQQK